MTAPSPRRGRSRAGTRRTAVAQAAGATRSPESLTGQFLIAMPGMGDPNFARGITFICQHNQDGAMGLVVNRLSEYKLGDLLEQLRMPCARSEVATAPVLTGGPVQPERGFVLHDSDAGHWESSFRVNDMATVTTSRDILAALAEGRGPAHTLVTLGYAGWGAGQLEAELRDNAWLTVGADPRILFDTALEQRWGAAVALVGIDPAQLMNYAGHA